MKSRMGLLLSFLALASCGAVNQWDAELAEEFKADARECVEEQGFDYPDDVYEPEDFASGRAEVVAYDNCWDELAETEKYSELGFGRPSERLDNLRVEQFAWWRCVEDAGYVRVTDIPLSTQEGYPLMPTPANFAVDETDSEMRKFYEVSAGCSGDDVSLFQEEDGSFWYGNDPTAIECLEHEHDGDSHSHDCFFAQGYPGE